MNYVEYDFTITPTSETAAEILVAELAEVGFESFVDTERGLLAYVQEPLWHKDILNDIYLLQNSDYHITYSYKTIQQVNWNEEWEKNFSPINVENKVLIRAEFHESQNTPYEIIIQPKMSFGTGHHATTYLMIQQMLDMDFSGKKVLDIGCGTSILAIFSKLKGAENVLAIDIDEWAVENSKENAQRNQMNFRIEQGTAENLGKENFDIILANINRNILISDIPTYVSVLNSGGKLLLSGLCFFDVNDILDVCTKHDLVLKNQVQKEEWVSLLLEKP